MITTKILTLVCETYISAYHYTNIPTYIGIQHHEFHTFYVLHYKPYVMSMSEDQGMVHCNKCLHYSCGTYVCSCNVCVRVATYSQLQ